jgi:hypothetical protein
MEHGKRILVVDDNKEFCHKLFDILEVERFDVEGP